MATKIFYEFSDFRLDPQQRLLTARTDSRPIPLQPKVFETLLYFVERRGELLEKATLLKAVWPNVVVEENSLNQNISAIRRVLGESPGEHRFIVTEPGRGYRFVAEVRVATVPDAGGDPTHDASPVASAPIVTTGGQRRSIAVLPFANMTGDPTKEYFSDGISEELLHTLARVPGLKVPSRTSSFSYKGRNIDVRQIARDLDVGVVLEGSVRSAGERIRITAQLIDGHNGFHLWSHAYDREFGDLFKLQDELAQSIVRALRLELGMNSDGTPLGAPPTTDLEAYHLYLQGLAAVTVSGPLEQLPRAIKMLERAVERDPKFARAHNAIAALRAVAIVLDVPLPGTLADSERDVLRALALDPSVGSAHAALGVVHAAQGKWVSARKRFDEAFLRDASDPTTLWSYGMHLLGSVGALRQYAELALEAHRLAPASMASVVHLGVAYTLLDEREPASRYANLGVTIGIPASAPPMADVLAQLAARDGRDDEAADLAVAALPAEFAAHGGGDTIRQVFCAARGRAPPATLVRSLNALRTNVTPTAMTQFMKRRFIVWYAMIGALDEAFQVITESLDYFARSGTIGTAWGFLWLPELLPLRQDPRFQAVSRRMGLFDYWRRYGPPDRCELQGGVLICR